MTTGSARVSLRDATPADAGLLSFWDTQPHVIAATGDDDVIDWHHELATPATWKRNLIGEVDGRPMGIVQIIDPRLEITHYWGEVSPDLRAIDIWIGEADDLGRGFGTQMMTQALDVCFGDPRVSAVLIDPLARNDAARRFYTRLGFQEVGPRTFGTDECVVYRLDRRGWAQGLA